MQHLEHILLPKNYSVYFTAFLQFESEAYSVMNNKIV